MFDVNKIRNDFPILKETMANKPLIYFDNSATSLKPQCVIDEVVNYYSKLSTNSHRGDYELSIKVDEKFDGSRKIVADFINATKDEIIFTSGTTESINILARSFSKAFLKANDEIIIDCAEHASNVLPWYAIAEELNLKIVFCPLTSDGMVTLENIKSVTTENTKLIAIAHTSNTLAATNDIKSICEFANSKNIFTAIDGAQGVPHHKIDVKDLNCDFFSFSAHKMCGPTGIGVLFGKMELLEKMAPYNLGGGMNGRFDKDLNYTLKKVPTVFEAGTQNIAGVLGLGAAINYLTDIGMENIAQYEQQLKTYAIEKLSKIENLKIYNSNTENSVVIFNVFEDDTLVFPQDVACYLNTFGIALRAGDHCAKLLDNLIGTRVTCRASFSFYNTKEEIDVFVSALEKCNFETVMQF